MTKQAVLWRPGNIAVLHKPAEIRKLNFTLKSNV